MELENTICKDNLKEQDNCQNARLHEEAYETNTLLAKSGTATLAAAAWAPYQAGYDRIAQEGMILGQMLDSGNAQWAAQRLQNDLYSLRPNRYAQNLLLNNVNIYDRKGIGSDLSLGYYNPYTASFSHGYIIPSVYRPFPTFPLSY